VTTAALTGLVELRDEGSSAPNDRHRRNDRDLHPVSSGTDVTRVGSSVRRYYD
jgi:hypothetical protein